MLYIPPKNLTMKGAAGDVQQQTGGMKEHFNSHFILSCRLHAKSAIHTTQL
jgi:hypothetical protein